MKLTNRHHLREDEAEEARSSLEVFGGKLENSVERAEADGTSVILVDGEVVAFYRDGEILPTVKALLGWTPRGSHVTVDQGAVEFVHNGADIMAPGIEDADPKIEEGDVVYVDEERHRKPLAVGKALVDGREMVSAGSGRAVENLHYVGDDLWNLIY